MVPVTKRSRTKRGRRNRAWLVKLGLAGAGGWMIAGGFATVAASGQAAVGLGTAAPFAVLAGTTVTNTGPSTVAGDVGVYPGTAITGFPPGVVTNGVLHAGDAVAQQAEADLTTAYLDAAARGPVTTVSSDLGGQTLIPGVYRAASGMGLTGAVTLNAQGDPSAVFIFQTGSGLTTASSSSVNLTGGAQACNVFWQVGSSATLGTGSSFAGTLMALTSATVQTGATVAGRVLARNGQVSLDDNTFTQPACTTAATSPSPAATPSTPDTGAAAGGNLRDGVWLLIAGIALVGACLVGAATRHRNQVADGPAGSRPPSGRAQA